MSLTVQMYMCMKKEMNICFSFEGKVGQIEFLNTNTPILPYGRGLNIVVVCENGLSADLGLPTVQVVCLPSVLAGIELCN